MGDRITSCPWHGAAVTISRTSNPCNGRTTARRATALSLARSLGLREFRTRAPSWRARIFLPTCVIGRCFTPGCSLSHHTITRPDSTAAGCALGRNARPSRYCIGHLQGGAVIRLHRALERSARRAGVQHACQGRLDPRLLLRLSRLDNREPTRILDMELLRRAAGEERTPGALLVAQIAAAGRALSFASRHDAQ